MFKYGKRRIIIFLAVIGLLIFLYNLGILKPFEGFFERVLNPVSSSFQSLGSEFRRSYNDKMSEQDLLAENKKLKEEVVKLTEENVDLRIVKQENEILREHLNFLTENNYKYLISNVVSRGEITDISDKSETVIIDKGSRDGLVPGLAVVSGKGVIVGKIAEVKESISLVYLTNNSKCKITATVLGQEGTEGVTEGELGLTIRMNFIPQSKVITLGDVVVTSGLEQYIPRGLIIGQVIEVVKDNNELWQNAVIESMSSSEDLVTVSVILPND